MQDMGWLLNNFRGSVAGIAHVVAVSADGLLLASSSDLPADRADQLAAIASGVVSLTEGASRMFNAGTVQQTIIEARSATRWHYWSSASGRPCRPHRARP
jgi:predicted regulator of Ras-like GTPase activity (Roadblock/LC7/MglB family)